MLLSLESSMMRNETLSILPDNIGKGLAAMPFKDGAGTLLDVRSVTHSEVSEEDCYGAGRLPTGGSGVD